MHVCAYVPSYVCASVPAAMLIPCDSCVCVCVLCVQLSTQCMSSQPSLYPLVCRRPLLAVRVCMQCVCHSEYVSRTLLICISTSKFTVYIQETKTKKTNVFVSYCSSRLSKRKRESEIGRRGNPIQHLPHQPGSIVHVLFSKLRTRRSGDWRGNAEK